MGYWKCGRVVECARLESERGESLRGFESYHFRLMIKQMFKNVFSDHLFHDFLYSCEFEFDSESIAKICEKMCKSEPKGVQYTNIGGWQSRMYGTLCDDFYDPLLKCLEQDCIEFTNAVCQQEKIQKKVYETAYWINVNKKGNYNLPHYHCDTHIIGIYYPRVPKNSGDLIILRTDSGSTNELLAGVSQGLIVPITPQTGRFFVFPGHLMHYVTPSESSQSRVSIAFGFKCQWVYFL